MFKAAVTAALTLRSVLRTQMKVQTEGLLLDFKTTNPPGPFSPLRERERVQFTALSSHFYCLMKQNALNSSRPDVATVRGFTAVIGGHSCRDVAVSPALHPTNVHKVPEDQEHKKQTV